MNSKISLRKNFIMNVILTLSSIIFPLITYPYVSRILLPEGVGKVTMATSFLYYFGILTQLGVPTYGVRLCSQVRDDKEQLSRTVHELLMIQMSMMLLSYVMFLLCLTTIPKLRQERALYLVMSTSIVLYGIGIEWLYRGLEQYSYITIRSVIFKFVALAGMLLLVHAKSDYIIYGALTIVASSLSAVVNLVHARKYIYVRPIGGYDVRRHLRPVIVFFLMSIATTVYTHLDTVMLGFMSGDHVVGYYNTAVKVKVLLLGFVTALGAVLLPRASYYYNKGQMEEFRRIYYKALNFVILLALPLVVYFIAFSRESIMFLSGGAFAPSIPAMQAIMPTVLLIGMTNIMGIQILVPSGREKTVLYSEIGGAVTDLILNMLLIPSLGATGAALGTLAAEMVVFIIQFVALKGEITGAFKRIKYPTVLLGVALGLAASLWVKTLPVMQIVKLIISAIGYFGVYYLTLLLLKEPLVNELTWQVWGKVTGILKRMSRQGAR